MILTRSGNLSDLAAGYVAGGYVGPVFRQKQEAGKSPIAA